MNEQNINEGTRERRLTATISMIIYTYLVVMAMAMESIVHYY
jgi:hypothetical protein